MKMVSLFIGTYLCVSGLHATTNTVPKEVFAEDKAPDGANIQIQAISVKDAMFRLLGEGFQPNEKMNMMSTSGTEVLFAPVQADSQGKLPAMNLMPEVLGKKGGTCRIDIMRTYHTSLHAQFPWGDQEQK